MHDLKHFLPRSNSAHRRLARRIGARCHPLTAPKTTLPQDRPARACQGNVSIQPNGVDDWGQAYPNQPPAQATAFTDQQSQGELQASLVRAYFSPTPM
jgi:hypothetical protein